MSTYQAGSHRIILALAAVCVLSACGKKQDDSFVELMPAASPDALFSGGDMVGVLHMTNLAEVEISKLAVERASDARVRAFAQSMIDEHLASDGTLMSAHGAIANQNVQLVQTIQRDAQETLKNLQGHSGATFDRLYIDHQVRLHAWLAENIEHTLVPATESGDLRDSGLEKTLEQTQTQVESQLLRARELQVVLR